ncbi:hypothetical protein TraAM80_09053 [Trypanosoma rangeli]|uniref:Uncharacterized protein n=1 Tax=Trypanosoma rangeli TaxID=5698 RepID=A0A422MXN2_TRYRA|nr:uncharacterized protein TraAM80_09053 [Trypanosoma rangeli]RNE97931.1 hypothetical protein TraAM80_09053 [Trypanosoma rangeli]|eukprot:RNE97931.1 hypothetical protein TraAM80_09053 [Trypanosoma rangeli]
MVFALGPGRGALGVPQRICPAKVLGSRAAAKPLAGHTFSVWFRSAFNFIEVNYNIVCVRRFGEAFSPKAALCCAQSGADRALILCIFSDYFQCSIQTTPSLS